MPRNIRDAPPSRTSSDSSVPTTSSTLRPSTKRTPSGAWGRLRAPATDPLEVYGLPSKGETRLNDPKAQESYFKKIADRYMAFCATSGGSENLSNLFNQLHVAPPLDLRTLSTSTASSQPSVAATTNPPPRPPSNPPSQTITPTQKSELELLIHAMRKLRESLTATSRTDLFAQRAYIFIAQSTLLVRDWSSYLPTLTHLLHKIHPLNPLPSPELRDVVHALILDLACRQDRLSEALAMRNRWPGARDRRVDRVLDALVRGDWVLFFRQRRVVDGYLRAVMGFAIDAMRVRALKALGRAYLVVEVGYLERCTEASWEELVAMGVGWEREGDRVTIRRVVPKGR
ncbi:hypothetical protein MBLNU457_5232t1 [Dothideomycetes sp. NU457]